jgi:acyl-CoA hydrolase
MEIQGKRVEESRGVMTRLMNLPDANPAGNVHGGVIMNLIDSAAGVVAIRHCRTNVVTASIDRLDLLRPIFIGDLVTFKASLNMVGQTSMEIGVRVDAENLRTGELRKVATAYLTYVALGLDGRPTRVPPLILETEEDIRRNDEARARREARLKFKGKSGPSHC